MGDRFFDFDAARAERLAAPPPTMRVFGEVVELPRSVPAAIHLVAARRESEVVTFELLVELVGYLVGADRVERWVAERPDLEEDDVRDLYYGAMRVIQASDTPDPEAHPPATGEQASGGETSQSTGGHSKPTSPVSTASTSPVLSGTT